MPLDIVKLLLEHGADRERQAQDAAPDAATQRGDAQLGDGATPLMRAAKVNDTSVMGLLLDKGADPNLRLRNQTTALMIVAARAGRNSRT